MVYISYTAIPEVASAKELFVRVKNAFPSPENAVYLGEIMSRKNEESRKESLCALLLLSELAEKADISSASLNLARSQSGKPYFKSSSVHFSLTHSKGYAAAALSDKGQIGLDLECSSIPHDKAQRLASRYFGQEELSRFTEKRESFARIWTKMEAYAKMRDIPLAEIVMRKDSGFSCTNEGENYNFFDVEGCPLTLCCDLAENEIFFFEYKA